MFITSTGY